MNYDENGNIIYELIKGKGIVKEYSESGQLRYEGEYLNGKRKDGEKNLLLLMIKYMKVNKKWYQRRIWN